MLIAFVHNRKAFLPEIEAYTCYFKKLGLQCEVVSPGKLHLLNADVEWHFMGTDMKKKKPGVFVVHEYPSASMPPLAGYKNTFKRIFNVRPNYRLFLNEYVRAAFSFNDGVEYGFRDMGVNKEWLKPLEINKQYDFIYVGEVRQGFERLLKLFTDGVLKERSLLVVSDYDTKHPSNIKFTGRVPHAEVQELICKARYGINFMPDVKPFNRQTSTKLLEYCACKVPVITSDYRWVREFESKYGGKYFYLKNDLSNFSWENIQQNEFAFPDLSEWTWEKQIEKSGVVKMLGKWVEWKKAAR